MLIYIFQVGHLFSEISQDNLLNCTFLKIETPIKLQL